MKVTDKNIEHMDGATKTQSTKAKSKSSKTSEAASSSAGSLESARVKLSDRAQDMKKIRAAVNATPDVDEAKVAKYRSMLAKGDYKVDSKAVADKMVDEHAYNAFFDTEE